MGERHDRATLVELHLAHGVVGHRAHQRHAGNVPGFHVFLARIADDHLVIEADRDLREVLRQLRRPDHEHAIARSMDRREDLAVEGQAVDRTRGAQARLAGCELEPARG